MALRQALFKRPGNDYTPKVDRLSMPSPAMARVAESHALGGQNFSTPSIQRLMDWGMKQTLCSENVLKSATLAQLKLLQEDVLNWVARRQMEPLLRLRFDNVVKRVPVSAVGRHLPAASFQAAWQLAHVHEEFITFMGLRSESGEELCFETSEELPDPHLANWEEKIREDQVYSVLYLDVREDMADQLTEEERKQILDEFDDIDSGHTGVVTTQEITQWCNRRSEAALAGQRASHAELGNKGDAGKRAADEKERLLRESDKRVLELFLQTDIDEDGTVELHEFFRARAQQLLAARGVAHSKHAGGTSALDASGMLLSPRVDNEFCPQCGKQFISAFCTGCGHPREGAPPDSVDIRSRGAGAPAKKKTLKKKKSAKALGVE